jgi:hypothetical protein
MNIGNEQKEFGTIDREALKAVAPTHLRPRIRTQIPSLQPLDVLSTQRTPLEIFKHAQINGLAGHYRSISENLTAFRV